MPKPSDRHLVTPGLLNELLNDARLSNSNTTRESVEATLRAAESICAMTPGLDQDAQKALIVQLLLNPPAKRDSNLDGIEIEVSPTFQA